jgi:hypothetical protein
MGEAKRRKAKDPNYGKSFAKGKLAVPLLFFSLSEFLKSKSPFLRDFGESRVEFAYEMAWMCTEMFLEHQEWNYILCFKMVLAHEESFPWSPPGKEFAFKGGEVKSLPAEVPRYLREIMYATTQNNCKAVFFVEPVYDGRQTAYTASHLTVQEKQLSTWVLEGVVPKVEFAQERSLQSWISGEAYSQFQS